jgi:hypothetical protein
VDAVSVTTWLLRMHAHVLTSNLCTTAPQLSMQARLNEQVNTGKMGKLIDGSDRGLFMVSVSSMVICMNLQPSLQQTRDNYPIWTLFASAE